MFIAWTELSFFWFQLYLTGAVYSLDGADCLKDTMQTDVEIDNKVRVKYTYMWKFVVSMICFNQQECIKLISEDIVTKQYFLNFQFLKESQICFP